MRKMWILAILMLQLMAANGQSSEDTVRVVNGFAIAAPEPDQLDRFVAFIHEELGAAGINTLVLRVDYRYKYESYPKLRGENPLSKKQVKQIVEAARAEKIEIIPQINLLGHQSWAEDWRCY